MSSEPQANGQAGKSLVSTELLVEGMTCEHCVASVTEELTEVSSVESVQVELHSGGVSVVRVISAGSLDLEAAQAAVVEAGYTPVQR